MPLGRYNKASQDRIHKKTCNCVITNQRTSLDSDALIDKLTRTLFDTSLDLHTTAVVRADQNWIEGDMFTVQWPERPGFVSTLRRVKFIELREDGIAILEMVIEGTTDL